MSCLCLGWNRVGEVNRVAGAGAVVLEGRTVPMVVEGEVNRVAGAGAVVLEGRTIPIAVEDAVVARLCRVLGRQVEDLGDLHRASDYWM